MWLCIMQWCTIGHHERTQRLISNNEFTLIAFWGALRNWFQAINAMCLKQKKYKYFVLFFTFLSFAVFWMCSMINIFILKEGYHVVDKDRHLHLWKFVLYLNGTVTMSWRVVVSVKPVLCMAQWEHYGLQMTETAPVPWQHCWQTPGGLGSTADWTCSNH